jgi:DNA-directed RNA polymerase specialized sigma24 family protein
MDTPGSSRFHTTHWSLIVALPARDGDRDSGRAREALEHLCGAYWRPLYTFARYSGFTPEDAQDLTQAFLERMLETGGLAGADPARGRFRSYLLGAMKHFIANARLRSNTRKRGGGRRFVDRDLGELESRIAMHPPGAGSGAAPADADLAFDRDWARETTDAALRQLAGEWEERGRSDQFDALRPLLTGEGPSRAELAGTLGMTENAVSVAIHRLRHRYAALVREAVARTVADEADIEDEMRYLIAVLRKK